jgi:ATP-dependent Lon protease
MNINEPIWLLNTNFLSNVEFPAFPLEIPSHFTPGSSQKHSAEEVKSPNNSIYLLPNAYNVMFPGIYLPMIIQKKANIQLVKNLYETSTPIGIITQKKPDIDPVAAKDIFQVGTLSHIVKLINLPDGSIKILVKGEQKFSIETILSEKPYLRVTIHTIEEQLANNQTKRYKAILQSIKAAMGKLMLLHQELPPEIRILLDNIDELNLLTYSITYGLNMEVRHKQRLLEIEDSLKRGTVLLKYLMKDIEIAKLKNKIQNKVHHDVSQLQQDFYIRHQIKALQEELSDGEFEDDIEELRAMGVKKKWNKEVAMYFEKILNKAERQTLNSPDYPILINHIELMLDLPWDVYTVDNTDLTVAEKVLNEAHYGMEKVKERLLEYLAVLNLKKNIKAPILCLYGPPGVGKTSLCKSIAKALNRNYVKVSLGGLHDEAEIRGHRKTYVGAMPGRIIKGFQKNKSSNPVFVLDEIDKVSDLRGDPAAALLEVLDAEQNNAFVDNFLELPYDLSHTLFITTANQLDAIPHALADRLEIIEVTGYTLEEKLQIAKKYLFPKQRKENGLKATQLTISDEAICKVIENYTRESGVRELERQLASLIRKIGKAIVLKQPYPKKLNKADVVTLLGIEKFDQDMYQQTHLPGIAIGLAWTPVGGDILFIETLLTAGKGLLTLSGQLGDVMKESATAALTYLKAHAKTLDIPQKIFDTTNLHIHLPAGAIQKDGPSAGITLFTALASLYTKRKVKDKLAMTGEITLRGKVLPVGGIKEKLLAAKRAGIKDIVLSLENKKDVLDIKPQDIQGLIFHYVTYAEEVLPLALQPAPKEIKDTKEIS